MTQLETNLEVYTDEDGWRWYGNKVSITTILENTVANPKLAQWYKQNSEKKIEEVKTRTANFGSALHEHIANILTGQKFDPEKVSEPGNIYNPFNTHIAAFMKWVIDNNVKADHCEKTMISEKLGIAGTTDFIGTVNGEETIIDWKTSTRYKITNGYQISAYREMAIESGLISKDCGMMGVQINRETAEIKTFKYEHVNFCFQKFLCALELFKGLYFHKLTKKEWPWLHEKTLEICI